MGIQFSGNDQEKLIIETSSNTESTNDREMKYLDTILLVYYDSNIALIDDEQSFKENLRRLTTSFITFDNFRLCKQWLKDQSDDGKILLIIRDNIEKKILGDIFTIESILSIYILPSRTEYPQKFHLNHPKVHSITSPLNVFVEQLSKDILFWEKISNGQSILIYPNQTDDDDDKRKTISSLLLMEVLLSTHYLPLNPSPKPFISYLRQSFSNDRYTLNSINEFEQSYSPGKSMQFLINEEPISRILNKALKDQDISILFDLRFFLRHLFDQIKSKHLSNITVYQKQLFSEDRLKSIEKNTNNYLIFNHFLIAHREVPRFTTMEMNNNQYEMILFQIDADFIDETTLFAFTDSNKSEVLFMCPSVFQIKSIKQDSNSIWMIHLILTEHKRIPLFNEKKVFLKETKDPLLLIESFDHLKKSKIFCEKLLQEYPPDHPFTSQIHDQLDEIYQVQPSIFLCLFLFLHFSFLLVSLTHSVFFLIGLPISFFGYSNEMIKVLQSLTKNSIIILDHPSEMDFNSLQHKTIFIFTTNEIHSFMNKRLSQVNSFFLLGEGQSDKIKYFDHLKDLLFELSDQLYRCYRWEMEKDLESGEKSLSNQKNELANQIHYQLKKLYRIKGDLFLEKKSTISKSTTLIWLKSNNEYHESIGNQLETLFTSFRLFSNLNDCYSHILTIENESAVYLIIDDEYKEKDVIGFFQLKHVKQIYRFVPNSKNEKKLLLKILHDLIDHYNQLSNQFEEEKDLNSSEEMLNKRRLLCEILLRVLK